MPVQEQIQSPTASTSMFSEPALLLMERGKVLCEETGGLLCGVVKESAIPDEVGRSYVFFIQATNKPLHYLLLSLRPTSEADYPLRLSNTLAGTVTQVQDCEGFKRQLRLIFHAQETIQLLERMRSFASQS